MGDEPPLWFRTVNCLRIESGDQFYDRAARLQRPERVVGTTGMMCLGFVDPGAAQHVAERIEY
jgi:hypothetical protein